MRVGDQYLEVSPSQTIPIHQPLDFPIQSIQALKDANITRFFCIDMGHISCSAILDKNVYKPGETAELNLSVDNLASDIDLKVISFKLMHICVAVIADDYKRVSHNVKCENRAPCVPRNQIAKIDLQLKLPDDLIPSARGELVKSKYKIEIEIQVPYSPNVILTLPIKIIN